MKHLPSTCATEHAHLSLLYPVTQASYLVRQMDWARVSLKLGKDIQDESSTTNVTISSIIVRSDDSLNSKIKEVNKIVAKFAKQSDWSMLSNLNITKEHLQ